MLSCACRWLVVRSRPSTFWMPGPTSMTHFGERPCRICRNWPYDSGATRVPKFGKFGVARNPRGADGDSGKGSLGGWGIAVSKSTIYPAQAVEFALFASSTEEQRLRFEDYGYTPTTIENWKQKDELCITAKEATVNKVMERNLQESRGECCTAMFDGGRTNDTADRVCNLTAKEIDFGIPCMFDVNNTNYIVARPSSSVGIGENYPTVSKLFFQAVNRIIAKNYFISDTEKGDRKMIEGDLNELRWRCQKQWGRMYANPKSNKMTLAIYHGWERRCLPSIPLRALDFLFGQLRTAPVKSFASLSHFFSSSSHADASSPRLRFCSLDKMI